MVGGSRDAMDVQIEGSVTSIETAFNVSMGVYQHPTENRTFYAPDREPTVDLPFPLWHISGLDNYSDSASRPRASECSECEVQGHDGLRPFGLFLRQRHAGGLLRHGTALTGTGQNIGLLEYYGYDIADLNTYYTNAGQTSAVLARSPAFPRMEPA